MRFTRTVFLGLALFIAFSSCMRPFPSAGFFTAETYVRPYKAQLDQPLTIIIDDDIPDNFYVQGTGLKAMNVLNFRKSLSLSLYYAFENSAPHILFTDSIAQEGITLYLYRVRPIWDVKTSRTSTTVIDGTGYSSTYIEYGALIRYDGMVYKDGKKWFPLDESVISEKTAWHTKYGPDVFQDAVREMCEDIYQRIVPINTEASNK